MLCQDIIEIIWGEVRVAAGLSYEYSAGKLSQHIGHIFLLVSRAQLYLIVYSKGQCYEIFYTSYHQKQFHRSPVLNGPLVDRELGLYTVTTKMKRSGDSAILYKTTRISSCFYDFRVVSLTISCSISESPLPFI